MKTLTHHGTHSHRRSGRECRNPEAKDDSANIPVFWIPAIHAGMTALFSAVRVWLLPFLLCLAPISWAADPAVFEFEDSAQEARFQRLTQELRCLVCQNQSLADSHADLAGDLRREIYQMIQKGQSDQAIIGFMVQRYGDFVLYRPPVSARTYALWFGPAILLVIAVVLLFRTLRRRSQEAPALSPEERKRISRMLEDDSP